MSVVGAVRSFRLCRWGVLAAVAALAGCGPSSLGNPYPDAGQPDLGQPDLGQPDAGQPDVQPDRGPPDSQQPDGGGFDVVPPDPDPIDRPTRYLASNRNVDLLFLVDDSSSMRLSQDNLSRNFPVLMQALKNQPGGLPNVHIGVISSDMGAGDGSIASCDSTGGKKGTLQFTPRGNCTASGLDPGATFISDVNGDKNYSGTLEDVFTCIAALGESGCGFEHQFASITRALGVDGRGAAPAENAGFLRPDALLAIVMITNEDDCSAAAGNGPNGEIPLYDATANINMASQLGPPANFRCNEFGHLCNDGTGRYIHPNRNAPNLNPAAMVSYDDCVSNDAEGYLLSVRETVNRIRALKADDGQVMVAAITGPRAPYVVTWRAPSVADTSCNSNAQSCPWPMIAHSCTAADGSFADPAVRIAEMIDDFGAHGRMLSICDGDFGPALADVGNDVVHYVSSPCITGRIAKKSGTTRDDCVVTDNAGNVVIPSCADAGQASACWRLVSGANGCNGVSVSVQDAQGHALTQQDITVDCQLCVPGTSDPARGCP